MKVKTIIEDSLLKYKKSIDYHFFNQFEGKYIK